MGRSMTQQILEQKVGHAVHSGEVNSIPEPMLEITSARDLLEADLETGRLQHLTTGRRFACSPTDPYILDMIKQDGIWEYYCRKEREQ